MILLHLAVLLVIIAVFMGFSEAIAKAVTAWIGITIEAMVFTLLSLAGLIAIIDAFRILVWAL